MSGNQDYIPFSNNSDTPRGSNNRNNWSKRNSFSNKLGQNNFSPYNKRNNFNTNKKFHGAPRHGHSNGEPDISAYYHPSMLHDPWRDLYKNLNQTKASNQVIASVLPENKSPQSSLHKSDSNLSNKSSDSE